MGISLYKRRLKCGGKVKLFAKKQLPVHGCVVIHVQVVWQKSCQVWGTYIIINKCTVHTMSQNS